MILNDIKSCLIDNANQLFGQDIPEKLIQFQQTRKEFEGDITLVSFPFVKMLKCAPEQAGEKIGSFLKDNVSSISDFNVVKGFLNLVVEDAYWMNELNTISSSDKYGFPTEKTGKTYMVEFLRQIQTSRCI